LQKGELLAPKRNDAAELIDIASGLIIWQWHQPRQRSLRVGKPLLEDRS
jgi:hypothetical protein